MVVVNISDELWLHSLGVKFDDDRSACETGDDDERQIISEIRQPGEEDGCDCKIGNDNPDTAATIYSIAVAICTKLHINLVPLMSRYVAILYFNLDWSIFRNSTMPDKSFIIGKIITRLLDFGIPSFVLQENERLFHIANSVFTQLMNYHSPWLVHNLNVCEVSISRDILKPLFLLEDVCGAKVIRLWKLQTMAHTGSSWALFLLCGFLKDADKILECTSHAQFMAWYKGWMKELLCHETVTEPVCAEKMDTNFNMNSACANDATISLVDRLWNQAKSLAQLTPKTYSELFDICLMGVDKLRDLENGESSSFGRLENVLTDVPIPAMDASEFVNILRKRAEIKTWLKHHSSDPFHGFNSNSPQSSVLLSDTSIRARLRSGIELQDSLASTDGLQDSLEQQCKQFLQAWEIVVIDGREFSTTLCPWRLKTAVSLVESSKTQSEFLDHLETVRGKCLAFIDEDVNIKQESVTGKIIAACLERSVSKLFVISGGFQNLVVEIQKLSPKFHHQLLQPIQRWNLQKLRALVDEVPADQIRESVKVFFEKEGEVFAQATGVFRKKFKSLFAPPKVSEPTAATASSTGNDVNESLACRLLHDNSAENIEIEDSAPLVAMQSRNSCLTHESVSLAHEIPYTTIIDTSFGDLELGTSLDESGDAIGALHDPTGKSASQEKSMNGYYMTNDQNTVFCGSSGEPCAESYLGKFQDKLGHDVDPIEHNVDPASESLINFANDERINYGSGDTRVSVHEGYIENASIKLESIIDFGNARLPGETDSISEAMDLKADETDLNTKVYDEGEQIEKSHFDSLLEGSVSDVVQSQKVGSANNLPTPENGTLNGDGFVSSGCVIYSTQEKVDLMSQVTEQRLVELGVFDTMPLVSRDDSLANEDEDALMKELEAELDRAVEARVLGM
eukprot:Gregarina_sp_Poly_1__2368@NODE_1634_length_3669_cov_76_060800_g431_i2_p1_GENE_NODE_1634_length_3669_cov_76_060800_g431_i2NODE_1634_length_3669_cov_76_060800_g431_i2_p1_ORF_typecomplete_len909_score148_48_NODE_1634_length_3669_cov_76_060800_g431_i28313557